MNTIWEQFLRIVKEEATTQVVETWLKALTFVRWDAFEKTLYLQAPNKFVRDWVTSNYMHLFNQYLSRLLNEENIRIIFLDKENNNTTNNISSNTSSNISNNISSKNTLAKINKDINIVPAKAVVNSKSKALVKTNNNRVGINSDYVFDNFVVGPHNSLAYAAARAITENPGKLYNPLFIYGNSGLGKTHLLQAIGNEIHKKSSKTKLLYQSADQFLHDFISAIRFDKIMYFENKYKSLDVLLIDDIQFISNKEQTQEVFFHIFNSLYEAGKQIVFSSDSLPKDIAGLAQRLRSRLSGGLIADIQRPALETKIAILKKKAEYNRQVLDDDIAYYIASLPHLNIRELEGFLIRVIAYSSLVDESLTIDLVKRVLLPTIDKKPEDLNLDVQVIASKVASYYHLTIQELRSTKRHKNISLARHVAMYLMKKLTDYSLSDIAAFWHRKDHSTVSHALDKIDNYKAQSSLFLQELHKIEEKILNS